MSGSGTPFVKLYDGYYFTPEHEPCKTRYKFDKALIEEEHFPIKLNVKDFDTYLEDLEKKDKFLDMLSYEKIQIIEKEV